jgi:Secretion system C-terminal sorting domain
MWNKFFTIAIISLGIIPQMIGQNNPIFYGGSGAGFSKSISIQTSNDLLFNGNSGDGFAASIYIQNSNSSLYYGGSGDGYIMQSYIQDNPSTTFGGSGDGHSSTTIIQSGDDLLFIGGSGDGNVMQNTIQESQDGRFIGGIGDGWVAQSVTFIPLIPLPITLIKFTGDIVDDTHLLSWSTAAETNSSHFVVEHASNLVQKFFELGMVSAKGNNSEYTFINKKPIVGDNFYRLKIKEKDGQFVYSNTILLKLLADKSTIEVFPNPTASLLNIKVQSKKQLAAKVRILSGTGKIIQDVTAENGRILTLDIANWAAGLYIVQVQQGNEISQIKVMKQ